MSGWFTLCSVSVAHFHARPRQSLKFIAISNKHPQRDVITSLFAHSDRPAPRPPLFVYSLRITRKQTLPASLTGFGGMVARNRIAARVARVESRVVGSAVLSWRGFLSIEIGGRLFEFDGVFARAKDT